MPSDEEIDDMDGFDPRDHRTPKHEIKYVL